MADWASERGHYYDAKTGEPRYTVISKSTGLERPTTLRDARQHGWVPSVTTITACAARYQLERWKAEQLLLAGLTLPRIGGEDEEHWIGRVWEDSAAQAKKAAERGTQIHGALEAHFAEKPWDGALAPWVYGIDTLLKDEFGPQEWSAEKSFASPLGYGGKVDLHSASVLIDFKGKEQKNGVRDWKVWDENVMQLAAYAHMIPMEKEMPWNWRTCAIVFFDRNDPYCELHRVKPVDLERGWRCFKALLDYWKALNRIDS